MKPEYTSTVSEVDAPVRKPAGENWSLIRVRFLPACSFQTGRGFMVLQDRVVVLWMRMEPA